MSILKKLGTKTAELLSKKDLAKFTPKQRNNNTPHRLGRKVTHKCN